MTTTTAISVRHLYVSPGHNFVGRHGRTAGNHPAIERAQIHCLAGRGIEGDRFLDFKPAYSGQITFFSQEVYEAIRRELNIHDKPPSVFRRNVITSGADLNSLIGKEFEIQEVRFLGTEECRPCYWMDQAFGPGAEAFLRGRGGLRAVILKDGALCVDAP